MSLLRYGFGVILWKHEELRGLDTKTQKVLTKANFHHERSDAHRIYLSRQYVEHGLLGGPHKEGRIRVTGHGPTSLKHW